MSEQTSLSKDVKGKTANRWRRMLEGALGHRTHYFIAQRRGAIYLDYSPDIAELGSVKRSDVIELERGGDELSEPPRHRRRSRPDQRRVPRHA